MTRGSRHANFLLANTSHPGLTPYLPVTPYGYTLPLWTGYQLTRL